MNRLIVSTLLAGAALAASPIAMAQAHWTYEGEAGPENWGKLDPKFVMCGIGRNQSPIDKDIGTDFSVAWIWRPYMHQNVIVRLSGALLDPGDGFADLYGDDETYYTVLGNIVLNY